MPHRYNPLMVEAAWDTAHGTFALPHPRSPVDVPRVPRWLPLADSLPRIPNIPRVFAAYLDGFCLWNLPHNFPRPLSPRQEGVAAFALRGWTADMAPIPRRGILDDFGPPEEALL